MCLHFHFELPFRQVRNHSQIPCHQSSLLMIFYTSARLVPLAALVLHVMTLVASPLQEPGLLLSLAAPFTSVLSPQSEETSHFPPTITAKSHLKIRQEDEGLETYAFGNGDPTLVVACTTGSN